MKNRYLSVLLILVFVNCLSSFAYAQKTIAVMPFEGGSGVHNWYLDKAQMISGITESLTDELSKVDGIKVVERSRLAQILKEQDFGQSDRVDTFSAAEVGRLLGADILVMGTVLGLDVQDSGGIRIGIISAKGTTAKIDLSVRIVDVETGVILDSMQADGSHTGAGFGVSGFRGVSFHSNTFKDSVLGKALDKALVELISEFESRIDNWEAPKKEYIEGSILAVVGDRYIISLGQGRGISRGDRFSVYELVQVPGLTNPVEVPVGSLRIISVDAEASVAEAEDAEDGTFDVGHVVRKE